MSSNYLVKNIINNKVVYSLKTQTILQACMGVGIEIPRYCFHNRLSIAGNCRMCLVEVHGSVKPVASCAQKVLDGNVVLTNSELVRRIREGVSQFLLYNHPLDCAVCDQGGECDLQDQVLVYGTDKGRFFDYKRTSYDKECGPLVKTVMTRCIHCTRCVRFLDEVSGSPKLGTMGRGQTMEISGYLDEILDTEISGNLIDLCPVGALTSKPGAYTNRSWEVRSIESLDVFDSLGSNIRVDTGFSDIIRIVPLSNDNLNEEWISDKIRFAFDGLSRNRIGSPMKRVGTSLIYTDWLSILKDLFVSVGNFSLNDRSTLTIVSGLESDLESMFLLKNLSNSVGHHNIVNDYGISNGSFDFIDNISFLYDYNLLSKFDFFFLVGANFKLESPLLNLKLRKRYLSTGNPAFLVGTFYKTTFPVVHLGNSVKSISSIISIPLLLQDFIKTGKLLVLSNLNNSDKISYSLLAKLGHCINTFSKVVSVSNFANYLGWANLGMGSSIYSNDTGISSSRLSGKYFSSNSFLLEMDKMNALGSRLSKYNVLKSSSTNVFKSSLNIYHEVSNISTVSSSSRGTNIFIGSHGNSSLLDKMDFVLPSVTFIEKKGSFLNIFNDLQTTSMVFPSPKLSKNNLKILNVLFSYFIYFGSGLFGEKGSVKDCSSYENLWTMGSTDFLSRLKPTITNKSIGSKLSSVVSTSLVSTNYSTQLAYSSIWENFYKTNLITDSSKIMGECSNNLNLKYNYFFKEV